MSFIRSPLLLNRLSAALTRCLLSMRTGCIITGLATGNALAFKSSLELSALASHEGITFNGQGRDYAGYSVSGGGDINGDGIDDIVIAAPDASKGQQRGQVYVLFGRSDGFPDALELSALDGNNGFTVNGEQRGDRAGDSVGVADINGDNVDDLIIGAPDFGEQDDQAPSGRAYVVLGRSSSFPAALALSALTADEGIIINAAAAGDRVGDAVSAAGDVNADGIADFIIAASGANHQNGRSYLIFGRSSGFAARLELSTFASADGVSIENNTYGANGADLAVSAGGDVNGDTIDDFIIGFPYSDPNANNAAGQSYLIFGRSDIFPATLELSALNPADGFVINGINPGDYAGRSVAVAGDINQDGIDDIAIGANSADPNGIDSGQSYVVFGRSDGFPAILELALLDGDNGFTINGVEAYDQPGSSGNTVAKAGDINADGVDDLVISAPLSPGQAYLVFGQSGNFDATLELSTLDGSNGFSVDQVLGGEFVGQLVSSVGDVNSDTIDDIVIGAPGTAANGRNSGRGYIVFGRSTGFPAVLSGSELSGGSGFIANGINGNEYTGTAVSVSGDVNGDGLGDILITTNSNRSYLVFGHTGSVAEAFELSSLDGNNGFVINNGTAADPIIVDAVSGAGDVNGDGLDDMILGASTAAVNGPRSGQAYVLFGRSEDFPSPFDLALLDGDNGFIINGVDDYSRSAKAVSSAGDINNDGIDDVIIGVYQASPDEGYALGQSYIVFGRSTGMPAVLELSALNNNDGFIVNGSEIDGAAGFSVANAGDVNNDNIDDIIIGAPGVDSNGEDSGQSYILYGRSEGFNEAEAITVSSLDGTNGFTINGMNAGDKSGFSVASAGDINGDSIDDVIIGAPYADGERADSGQGYLIFGRSNGFPAAFELATLDGANGFAFDGVNDADYAGWSVHAGGDNNGDGIDDVIIGAYKGSPNNIRSGQIYLIFGRTSEFPAVIRTNDLDGTNGFVGNGTANDGLAGYSVSGGSDINGDTIDDVIISAHYNSPSSFASGQTYVVFGTQADLTMNITDLPDPVPVNTTVDFTFNVINNGPTPTSNVQIAFTFPAEFEFKSFSGTDWSCSGLIGTTTCTQQAPLLANETSPLLTLTFDANSTGIFTTTAVVSSADFDDDENNNTATETTTVLDIAPDNVFIDQFEDL